MPGKPNLFIVGAAKSGTSSLYHYLRRHPDVFMSPVKEPHFFCAHHFPEHFTGPGDQGFSDHVTRTQQAYFNLYEQVQNETVVGEGSVYYLYYPDTAQRIHAFNPEAKVIIMLRNPIERAFSAYMHTVRDGRETLSFEAALTREDERRKNGYQPLWWYREVGLYRDQVKRYLDTFDAQNIKIILYEDLVDTPRVVNETLGFLGIATDVSIDTTIKYNPSGVPKSRMLYNFFAKPNLLKEIVKPFLPKRFRRTLGERAKLMTLRKDALHPQTKRQLQNDFKEDIKELQELIKRDLTCWLT